MFAKRTTYKVFLVLKAPCEVHKKQSIPRSKSTAQVPKKVFLVLKATRKVYIKQSIPRSKSTA